MKTLIISLLLFVFFIGTFSGCKKYEIIKYQENKVKYLIKDDTTEYIYNYKNQLSKIRRRRGRIYEEYQYIYKNEYIIERRISYNDSIPNKIDELIENILIPNKKGYIIKKIQNADTFYYEYDSNDYLIKETYRYSINGIYKTAILKFEISNGNIYKEIINSDTLYYEYGIKSNNTTLPGTRNIISFYGKYPKNNITQTYCPESDQTRYFNYMYSNNRIVEIQTSYFVDTVIIINGKNKYLKDTLITGTLCKIKYY